MPRPARRAGCLVRAVRRGASAPAPVCHRDPESTLALQYERSAGASEGVLSVGASRQLSDSQRLKGRCTTQGILGVALETAGEKHIISFVGEVDAQLARGSASALNPKCGVNLQLSL